MNTRLLTLHAAVLAVLGAAMLFVPAELGAAVVPSVVEQALFVQILGAALIGFAAANWIVRRSPVGGIYGRAIVVGNQAFSLVGVLVLLGSFPAAPGVGFWLLLAVFAGGALLHGTLFFKGPRLNETPKKRAQE